MNDNIHQKRPKNIALIGFGEAAQAFYQGWSANISCQFSAFDIKSLDSDLAAKQTEIYAKSNISGVGDIGACITGVDGIFSLVTADQALNAAENAANHIPRDCFYFDCNSCAPDTKKAASRIITAAGGIYIDVAIMAPVHPLLHRAPLLVSGPNGNAALAFLTQMDMGAEFIGAEIGRASSIKMIRSIMMKGLEALIAECVLSGRKAGVENIVLDTLEKTYPGFNWHEKASYMLERMMVHGPRRAAEMREVALTVEQLGVDNSMSKATTNWQQIIGDLGLSAGDDDLSERADAILSGLENKSSRQS